MLTVGPSESLESFREDLVRAVASLKNCKLGVLYAPFGVDHLPYYRTVSELLGCPMVGCTTGGASFTERGVTTKGVVFGVLAGDDVSVSVTAADYITSLDDVTKTLGALQWPTGKSKALLTFFDPYAFDGEALVNTISKKVSLTCQLFGASAGDDWVARSATVFCNDRALQKTAVFVAISSTTPVKGGVRHGWRAANVPPFMVTKASGNIVWTLNNRPAADVYIEALQSLGLIAEGENPQRKLGLYELGLKTLYSDELKIRAPLYVGADRSIILAGTVPEGSRATLVITQPEALIDAAAGLSRSLVDERSAGLLAFDCAARYRILNDRYVDQQRAYGADKPSLPLLGFASFGEIARFSGQLEGFHNSTAVLVAL